MRHPEKRTCLRPRKRRTRPEIKAMDADVQRTQDAEIQQMKAWRRTPFG
jgi:uncharacterized protein (DUF305 family)